MSALPDHSAGWPPRELARLLTVEEYAELGEPDFGYTELVEGRLLLSPSPAPRHNIASFELAAQVKPQLPSNLTVVQDVDIDLGLVPADFPGFARRPDLVIVERAAIDRVGNEGGMLRASEVVVVIEIVSPAPTASTTSTSTANTPTRVFRITGSSTSTSRSRSSLPTSQGSSAIRMLPP